MKFFDVAAGQPIFLDGDKGETKAVVINAEDYRAYEAYVAVGLEKVIAHSEDEIAQGRFVEFEGDLAKSLKDYEEKFGAA